MKKIISFLMTALLMSISAISFISVEANSDSAPSVIPAIREWQGSNGRFVPDQNTVLVNLPYSSSVEKIKTFFSEMVSLDLEIDNTESGSNEIVFALDSSLYKKVGNEGYTIEATESAIKISAPTEIGLLYGGISVVQSVTADGFFPCGSAVDYPAFPVRSGMIDVGRAWIPLDYVNEITRYMAYYKLNEVHLHINDDGENGYSGFRLESDVKGLASEDGYYTKDEYRAYQKEMLEYGISVVTEIDTPFHSSCYAKAENPPPYLPGNKRCLDVSKPETLEFVKNLFAEYMTGDDPVFVGKVVHIGTDEYPREYAEEMRAYTNALIEYVNSLGYTPRFWGGLGPDGFQGTTPMSENAQMNYWDNGISGLKETLDSNYDFVNTVNAILYTVPTTNYSFPDYFDLKTLYNMWQVNMFSLDGSAKCEPDDERLLGACFALWNDLHTAYKGVTRFDIFDRLRGMVCLISEKTWCGLDTASVGYESFKSRYDKLSLRAGDADPGRHSLSDEGITVDFESDFSEITNGGKVENGKYILDGESYISLENLLSASSVGFPNTLEFEICLDEETDFPIFSGDGVQIFANADGKGNFGFKTEVYTFTYDYKLPIGENVKIRLSSDLKTTYLTVNDALSYSPQNSLNPQNTKLSTLTIPISEIGKGIKGTIDNIKITPTAVNPATILANYNIALNCKTSVSGLEVNDGRFTSSLAVDGDEATRLSFARDKDEQWLLLDLGDVYDIARIEIVFFEHVSEYEIYVSEDGAQFTKVYSLSNGAEQVKQTDNIVLENSAKGRYIKYVQLKRWYMPDWNTYYSGGISEFRAYSFNEQKYHTLLKDALSFLQNTEKNDPRRATVKEMIFELENLLAEKDVFIANAEFYYNELQTAMNTPIIETESSVTEVSESAKPENNTGNKWLIATLVAAAVAVIGTAVVFIKKKRKK
ncbi:MAG: hypothetical protein E7595_03295 [Ruminococcaceae bacterium]|nr:hypothetical protein [Oscillospiraceae bacterium]